MKVSHTSNRIGTHAITYRGDFFRFFSFVVRKPAFFMHFYMRMTAVSTEVILIHFLNFVPFKRLTGLCDERLS